MLHSNKNYTWWGGREKEVTCHCHRKPVVWERGNYCAGVRICAVACGHLGCLKKLENSELPKCA